MAKENPQPKPYVVSLRTALSGPEDSIMKKLPSDYANSTVREVISYLTNRSTLEEDEAVIARSIRSEMAKDYSIVVNGNPVQDQSKVTDLFQEKTHKGVAYDTLDIEVASVQEGGLVSLLV